MKSIRLGPALFITAAFIGPGTVYTATLAGANFGYALLWAVLFSVVATIILQEMTARLGVVTQQGLGENLSELIKQPLLRLICFSLIISAIVIGNAAYEGGNIVGASLGLSALFPQLSSQWPIAIGLIAFFLLYTGNYKVIEKGLATLVAIMSIAFIVTLLIVQPNLKALFSGLFVPSFPAHSTLTIIALIGTTVVPYNLFLHASSVCQKWHNPGDLTSARQDLYVAIPIGGLITLAILSTAAVAFFGSQLQVNSVADIAPSLQPLFGDFATYFMAIGLFCAGVSSAITAPLAAAYAIKGLWRKDWSLTSWPFKGLWLLILLLGTCSAYLQFKPIQIIWFAQVANGLLLPLITLFLLWLMNSTLLGEFKNNRKQNVMGITVLAVTILLSGKSLMAAFSG